MNVSISMNSTDVLIVGAGPTGLVLALWLTRLGIRVRIVDKTAEPGTTSRALAVQARTLELYRQIGLSDAVVEPRSKDDDHQSLDDRPACRARGLRRHGQGSQSVSLCADLPAGRARTPADRSARQGRRAGRAADGARGVRGDGRRRARASPTAPTAARTHARPPISPAATARTPPSAKDWRLVFPAAPTTISFTSPMSRRAAQ